MVPAELRRCLASDASSRRTAGGIVPLARSRPTPAGLGTGATRCSQRRGAGVLARLSPAPAGTQLKHPVQIHGLLLL